DRHFTRLALAHADAAVAVANHCQGCEAHGATTLHNLADAVDRDHFFAQAVVIFLFGSLPTLCFSHLTIPCLEFQASFTSGFCQRLDAAMITEARAIECNRLDACSFGLFSHALANQSSRSNVAAVAQILADVGFERGSADQHTVAFR